MILNLLLAAGLALTPPETQPVQLSTPPPAIVVQSKTDSFDILLVVWKDKDHFHVSTLPEFQKAMAKCKAFNISMFDEKDGGIMMAFNCFL